MEVIKIDKHLNSLFSLTAFFFFISVAAMLSPVNVAFK